MLNKKLRNVKIMNEPVKTNTKIEYGFNWRTGTTGTALEALKVLLDRRDTATGGHSLRVVRYTEAIAAELRIQGQELEDLRLGALLHDIGKIAIPDSILLKPGSLNRDEWVIMKTHPRLGADMISMVESLQPAIPIVLHHHEWYNGSGYPAGLIGDEIPLGARIFAIADAFDAMTSVRPYSGAMDVQSAIKELKAGSGTQFCPVCLQAFLNLEDKNLPIIYDECRKEAEPTQFYGVPNYFDL